MYMWCLQNLRARQRNGDANIAALACCSIFSCASLRMRRNPGTGMPLRTHPKTPGKTVSYTDVGSQRVIIPQVSIVWPHTQGRGSQPCVSSESQSIRVSE